MKKDEVKIGGTYLAKVTDQIVPVRLDAVNAHGGWDATNLKTNKKVRIKSAQRLRAPARDDKKPASADPDRIPLTEIDKAKRADAKPPRLKPTKAAPEKEPKKLSCLDAAAQVLATEGKPMNCKAMINAMHNAKLWTSDAPTPAATLYSAILREMTSKGSASRFKKVDRGDFALSGK